VVVVEVVLVVLVVQVLLSLDMQISTWQRNQLQAQL
jgi:hypothetical protein